MRISARQVLSDGTEVPVETHAFMSALRREQHSVATWRRLWQLFLVRFSGALFGHSSA